MVNIETIEQHRNSYSEGLVAALNGTRGAGATTGGSGSRGGHGDSGHLGSRHRRGRRGTTGHGDRKDGEGKDEVESSDGTGEHF